MRIELNKNFENLSKNYVFAGTAKRVAEYRAENPNAKIIDLGIGDVSLPLSKTVVLALKKAVEEQQTKNGFRGYAPYCGYDFLKKAVVNYYKDMNISLEEREIFISDGAKSDVANLLDIFGIVDVLLPVPCYPAYIDTNIIKGNRIRYINLNGGLESLSKIEKKPYLIYLCSPNNPTGTTYDRRILEYIVKFSLSSGSIILFDAAYSAFIRDSSPKCIYEINGAEDCAIEINSFSKSHGFTGLRLGWSVIPCGLVVGGKHLSTLWERRLGAKYNGVPYIVQRAGEAALSSSGMQESKRQVDYYLKNAKMLKMTLDSCGVSCVGGDNAPYVWLKCPFDMQAEDFFEFLLKNAQIVGGAGSAFGFEFSNFFRFSAFACRKDITFACQRLKAVLTEY